MEGQGEGGVGALDFRVLYDPAILRPVSVEAGQAALDAGKKAMGNVAAAGQYVVLVMSFDKTTISSGEVARLQLEQIQAPTDGVDRISIGNPTLSTLDGLALPSEGDTIEVQVAAAEPAKPSPKPRDPTTPTDGEKPDNGKVAPPAENTEVPEAAEPAEESAPVLGGPIGAPIVPNGDAPKDETQRAREQVQAALNRADIARRQLVAQVPGAAEGPDGDTVTPDSAQSAEIAGVQAPSAKPAEQATEAMAPAPPLSGERATAADETVKNDVPAATTTPSPAPTDERGVAPETKRIITGIALLTLAVLLILRRRLVH